MTTADTNGRRAARWLAAYSALASTRSSILPILVLVIYSFNGQGIGGFPPAG
jgi:ABC-type spermidine/putrescine transport system permease subunit II